MNRTQSSSVLQTSLPIATVILVSGLAVAFASDPLAESTSDRDLSLSKTSVFEDPAPSRFEENQADPGELPKLHRAYASTPPRVPHNVVDLLPITPTENWCLDCHQIESAEEGDPTPIPPSHFVDFRRESHQMRKEVVGARYVCVTCHVAPTSAPPLLENTFRAAKAPAEEN